VNGVVVLAVILVLVLSSTSLRIKGDVDGDRLRCGSAAK
jgi:hypothetical protein